VIASIQFRHFKALRATSLQLEPFNLIIGPNGSGKTSLIQAILRLRNLSQLPPASLSQTGASKIQGPELSFGFDPPFEKVHVNLSCVSEMVCDLLHVESPRTEDWDALKALLVQARVFLFDHYAMAVPSARSEVAELATNGGNLAAMLAMRRSQDPALFSTLEAEALRLMPEFSHLELRESPGEKIELGLVLKEEKKFISADAVSQGNLYMLALLALVFDPKPPAIVCIEDVDRGIHPRKLRDIKDLLYRLSYPSSFGLSRDPVQVIATTHSPYLLDQFRDHPEEVVIAQKHGRSATFERLIDRPDLDELLKEGSLGDMWFSGILGGVPDDETVILPPKTPDEGNPGE
jgi:predicted ATPase